MLKKCCSTFVLVLAGAAFAQEKQPAPANDAQHATTVPAEHDSPLIDARADAALRQMCDFLKKLPEFRYVSEVHNDQFMRDGQKIELTRRLTVELKRPSMTHLISTGDDGDYESFFDGDKCTVVNQTARVYSVVDTPNSLEESRDYMAEKYDMEMPNSDILMSDPYKELTDDVLTGKYVGQHRVGDTLCHHLAFTQTNVDWQVWIAQGDKPLPRKFIVTYKKEPGVPQFVAEYTNWELAPKMDAKAFAYQPKRDFHKVELEPVDGAATQQVGHTEQAAPAHKD